MKTQSPENVGKHAFELAGLGIAPFRFIGTQEKLFTVPGCPEATKPGSSCDYCGTAITTECWLRSSDGKQFKVGCNCIEKAGDKGVMQAYKSSPEYRAKEQIKRNLKDKQVCADLDNLIAFNRDYLASQPHPRGFKDFKTGEPMTALNDVLWLRANCGASGRAALLKRLSSNLPAHNP